MNMSVSIMSSDNSIFKNEQRVYSAVKLNEEARRFIGKKL